MMEQKHFGSHFIDIPGMPWEPAPGGGGLMKVLFRDPDSEMATILFKMNAGAVVPFHEHPEVEQTYMIEGRLVDDQGECTAGSFVWREAGSRHQAHTPEGCMFIAFFMKPSRRLPVS